MFLVEIFFLKRFKYIYRLSYLHYSGLAVLVTFIVGMIVSAISGLNKARDVDPKLCFDYSKLFFCFNHNRGNFKVTPMQEKTEVVEVESYKKEVN